MSPREAEETAAEEAGPRQPAKDELVPGASADISKITTINTYIVSCGLSPLVECLLCCNGRSEITSLDIR